ncbi:MAG: hypothetical protein RL030_2567 [Pseudomonadota bacterium]
MKSLPERTLRARITATTMASQDLLRSAGSMSDLSYLSGRQEAQPDE